MTSVTRYRSVAANVAENHNCAGLTMPNRCQAAGAKSTQTATVAGVGTLLSAPVAVDDSVPTAASDDDR